MTLPVVTPSNPLQMLQNELSHKGKGEARMVQMATLALPWNLLPDNLGYDVVLLGLDQYVDIASCFHLPNLL